MTDNTLQIPARRHNRPLGVTAERELRRLLEKDEAALKELQEYESWVDLEVLKSISKCASALAALENAKHRQDLALELHQTLKHSIDALKLSDSASSKLQNYSLDDVYVEQHLANISLALQGRTEVIEGLSKDLAEALKSISRARETVIIAEEDYQGALTVLWHHKEERVQTRRRASDIQETIHRKKIPLQAAFRLPPHVWEGIFDYIVSADGEVRQQSNEIIDGWGHGSRTLMLSSVCYSWRVMIQSSPSLWRYIHIPLYSSFEKSWKRINLHLARCKSIPLVVSVFSMNSKGFQTQWLEKLGTWNDKKLARLYCFLASGTAYDNLSAFITKLPSPAFLRLYDNSELEGTFTPVLTMPPTFVKGINRMSTIDVRTHVRTDSSLKPLMKLGAYSHYARIEGRGKIPSWLRDSQIHALTIDAAWGPDDQHDPYNFTTVRELEIHLVTLSRYLIEGYDFPSLHKITLIHTEDDVDEDWEHVKNMTFQHVHTIGLEDLAPGHVTNFVGFVCGVQHAYSLELRGRSLESLETLFEDKTSSSSLNIQLLKISSYEGTANSILSFVRRLADGDRSRALEAGSSNTQQRKCPLREVVFTGCPNVEPETRLEIAMLLNGRCGE